jgi:SM-20-related protein
MLITNDLDQLMQKVDLQGWGQLEIQNPLLNDLIQRFLELEQSQSFRPASISDLDLAQQAKKSQTIRNDLIHWLTFENPAECKIEQLLNQIREHLKSYFRISLTHIESHFAQYPAGHFYKTHSDQTAQNNKRFFTFVIYLNPHWLPHYGGQMIGYESFEQKNKLFEFMPNAGTMVVFKSDIPHEVLPATITRRSLTGWFRT